MIGLVLAMVMGAQPTVDSHGGIRFPYSRGLITGFGEMIDADAADVVVDFDDTVIDEAVAKKCKGRDIKVLWRSVVITDKNENGVLHVRASGVTLKFYGSACASETGAPDTFKGTALRIEGQHDVTIKDFNCHGYKVGIHATNADNLTIDGAQFGNLYRQHLKSTPEKEDQGDWLFPHDNDDHQWRMNHGGAVVIESSKNVTVCKVFVADGQNGIILDRVSGSKVYDNDCSYLSGWGLAMWRSSENLISRNAFDFCIRGYSHGKYNRGQDSAGILMFEQCSKNAFIENSATHCGDGFFAFAGKEALGDPPPKDAAFVHKRAGCNENVIAGNDFSFAAAHGVELTFSFSNAILDNTLEGNAICGVWGGYSQMTTIRGNRILNNGLPKRAEGGGINIEHGYLNFIEGNTFTGNTQAVRLWWDNDEGIFKLPWGKANSTACEDNEITGNTFGANAAYVVLRAAKNTRVIGNTTAGDAKLIDADDASTTDTTPRAACCEPTPIEVPKAVGEKRPVGAEAKLRSREFIRMGEWGPVDPHAEPAKIPKAP